MLIMKLKKTFFVALTTIAAALAMSVSASAATLGDSQTSVTPVDPGVKTGDNSTAVVAVLGATGVAALGTAVVATKMKKKASK